MGRDRLRMRLSAAVAAAAVVACLGGAPAAQASRTQESQFQDDAMLVFPPANEVARTLDTLKALGVDRIRVSVFWWLVAPDRESRAYPKLKYGGADPDSYADDRWQHYDDLVRLAYARGIGVNFNVTGSAPLWATRRSPDPAVSDVYRPSPALFGQFVRAVATRYSGTFVPRARRGASPRQVPLLNGGTKAPPPTPAGAPLPRVSFWSIWNEPNQSHFLAPQWSSDRRVRGGRVEAAPRTYRLLLRAAYDALRRTGHGRDTILFGETAPKGRDSKLLKSSLKPLHFIRRLYCVDDRLRPLRGGVARAHGCPSVNQRRAFPKANPALFSATAYGHHPYALISAPGVRSSDPDFVALADADRLARTLRGALRAYGSRRAGFPLYYTEFGYQTRPPDPFGFSHARQIAYLNEAEFISYTDRRVRSHHQFLLRDAEPNEEHPRGSIQYWASFQTGLLDSRGGLKPAFDAYRLPIWVPEPRRSHASSYRVWGVVRPAPNRTRLRVAVQYRPRTGGRFQTIRTVTTGNARNHVDVHVFVRRSGFLRLAWKAPNGRTIYSRATAVRIG